MINPTTNEVTAGANSPPGITRNDKLGKDEFLELLVAQLRNQDPLSPLDGTEFAAQLAQFSSLEQLVGINDKLDSQMNSDLLLSQAINNTLAATLIGKEVTVAGNEVGLAEDGKPQLTFELGDFAKEVEITITDATGQVVRTLRRESLDAGRHQLEWDGKSDSGEKLPPGTYHFQVVARNGEGATVASREIMVGLISAVRYENGQAILVVNGEEIPMSNVLEIGLAKK